MDTEGKLTDAIVNEEKRKQYLGISSEFHKDAIKTSIILNGGALVLVPTFLTVFEQEVTYRGIIAPTILFIIGLLLGSTSSIMMSYQSRWMSRIYENARSLCVIDAYYNVNNDDLEILKSLRERRKSNNKLIQSFNNLYIGSIALLFSSTMSFTFGAIAITFSMWSQITSP